LVTAFFSLIYFSISLSSFFIEVGNNLTIKREWDWGRYTEINRDDKIVFKKEIVVEKIGLEALHRLSSHGYQWLDRSPSRPNILRH
jgi:hypothetical protein